MKLEIELYDPIPEPVDPLNQQAVIQPPITRVQSLLVNVNVPVQSLMYTATVIRDSLILLPDSDMRRIRLMAVSGDGPLCQPGRRRHSGWRSGNRD